MDCTNPSCKCQSIPKVREDQFEDWTLRSAETKARFGQRRETQKPLCRWCLLASEDTVEHPAWHDNGTAYAP